jgi:hypothetical protein
MIAPGSSPGCCTCADCGRQIGWRRVRCWKCYRAWRRLTSRRVYRTPPHIEQRIAAYAERVEAGLPIFSEGGRP